ncbi:hypothetical protein UC34_00265 [Pandoraea vervacti]|uniref:Uncharacterized protein n=1 Tax=Pandoraea vervacti TaxID=656178 RepID=A0ABN4FKR1_9BURK|nr:hypothetical protein [Pandoraea vervacti]AJP55845.1 hypothetical protein UC34_00265 [Pandoraea vervacti]
MESSSINLSGRGSPVQLPDSDRPPAEMPQGFAADVAGLSQTASTETFAQRSAAAPGQALRTANAPSSAFPFEAFYELWKKIVAVGGGDERQIEELEHFGPSPEDIKEILHNIDIIDRADRQTALSVIVEIAPPSNRCTAVLYELSFDSAWLGKFDEAQRTTAISLLQSVRPPTQ